MLSSPLKPEMWFSFSILGGKYEVKGCDFSVVIMAALNFCGFFFFCQNTQISILYPSF